MNQLSVEDGEKLIIEILNKKNRKLTTWELDKEIKNYDNSCPDEVVVFLAKMRQKGLIKGEISQEKRGWIWWV
jgi:predicted DNA-binding transcriptional regulator